MDIGHMDSLDREDLKALSASRNGHHVSIYMSVHVAAPANQQDPIRFKNLLREAEKRLLAAGVRSTEVRELLEPGRRLLEDGLFWRPRSGGLAVFIAEGGMRTYRLPAYFPEQVVVNSRFFVKPLVNAVDGGERFYVLALSQDYVRLYRGARGSLDEIPLPGDVPRSLQEAVRNDENKDDTRQSHSQTGGPARRSAGRRGAAYFGSGVDAKDDKRYIADFFHQVARGVFDIVKLDNAPMVLAGIDFEVPIYREANQYHHLVDEAVLGNPKLLGETELHLRAWHVVRPLFENARHRALERFNEFEGTSHASADTSDIVRASVYGRVDSLFVREEGHIWGAFDPASGEVHLSAEEGPDSEDLTDLAVTNTVLNGGSVYAGPVGDFPLAAIYRY